MSMTVDELISKLMQFGGDQQVRIAIQPAWPLRCDIVQVIDGISERDDYEYDSAKEDEDDAREHAEDSRIVWIAGEHVDHRENPYAPKAAFRR